MDDNKIIRLFWDRKEIAIEETDRKYRKLCFGIAWNILRNKEDSEECLYDTYLAAWNRIPPQLPHCLSAFLAKITRGFSIDKLRKKCASRRIPANICQALDETSGLNAAVKDFTSDLIEAQNILSLIEAFLQELSQKDREIFVQRYWYLLPNKEIGKMHHMKENAVKQNLLRSRRKLLELLKKEGYYENEG